MIFLVALVLGGLQSLCMPPLPLGPAIPLVLAAILHWISKAPTSKNAAWRGFLSGFVLQVGGLHWIRNVMSVGPAFTIAIGLVLLFAYLAAFQALWAWAWHRCLDRGIPWAWPFLFTGLEIARGYGQMSFPWMHLAYDFGGTLPLIQGAAWIGVYGLGWLVAATAAIAALALSRRIPSRVLALPAAFWVLWLGFGLIRLAEPVEGRTVRVAVVQPAISQTKKWDEDYFRTAMARTWATARRVHQKVDLWAFPETAIPDLWTWRPEEGYRAGVLADTSRASVVVGALEYYRDPTSPTGGRLRNSAFYLRPRTKAVRYDKLRLVPFSEHLPFDNILPALNKVRLGQSGFSSGDSLPVWFDGVPWAPAICFEMVHPDFTRLAVQNGARMVVVITNDGWFGTSLGPYQHWNIHRFRAVESGLSMVRSANTGISGATDHRGVVLASTPLMKDTAFVVSVPEGPGSFYGRHGQWIDRILGLAALASLVAFVRRKRLPDPNPTGR